MSEKKVNFHIYECSKCGKYIHENEILVNKLNKKLICISCASKTSSEEVKEMIKEYYRNRNI